MKRVAIVLGVLFGVLVLVAIGLSVFLDANRFKPQLESELSQLLGRRVTVGDLKFSIMSFTVSAGDLAISDDPGFSAAPFLKAKSLDVGAELQPLLFSCKLNVSGITIDDPEIVLFQAASGAWNFSSLGSTKTGKASADPPPSSGPSLDLSVKSVNIRKGRLTMGKVGSRQKPLVLESVDVDVKDFSSTSQFPFSLSTKVGG